MVLTQIIPPAPAPVATFNYEDLASGTGIIEFYGGENGGTYSLSDNKFYSSKTATSAIYAIQNTGAYVIDVDFDVVMNLPRTVRGIALVNVPIGVNPEALGKSFSDKVTIIIRHWDGSTETDLVSADSATFYMTGMGAGEYGYSMTMTSLTIPETHFKRGETLRVTAKLWAYNHNTGNAKHFIGHDPMNRATSNANDVEYGSTDKITFGTDPSILTAQIPFRIDQ